MTTPALQIAEPPALYSVVGDELRLNPHYGQARSWTDEHRFLFVFAGTQGGKTSWGPWWTWRETLRTFGPDGLNDALAVTASYDLFKLKMLPELRNVYERVLKIGRYWSSDRVIEIADLNPESDRYGEFWASRSDDPMWGRIILRAATAEGGLESSTAKWAWLDECGQDSFTLETWEAVQRRLSLSMGRVFGTTTLYNLGWLKSQIFEPWQAGDPDISVIQFPSIANPIFPQAEWDRVLARMPMWKVLMMYKGEFSTPPGLIYDVWSPRFTIPPFQVPDDWPRYGALDFGRPNLAALCFAESPHNHRLYLIKEYRPMEVKAVWEHAKELYSWGCEAWVGGAKSEDQWREDFRFATDPKTGQSYGLPLQEPVVHEVEPGIDRAYALMKQGRLYAFDTATLWHDELGTYSRELDDDGQPTEKIKDKNRYHLMDATRYFAAWYEEYSPTGGIHV